MELRGRNVLLLVLGAAAVVVLALVFLSGGGGGDGGGEGAGKEPPADGADGGGALQGLSANNNAGSANNRKPPETEEIENIYNFDASKKPVLAGYSQAIFSGKAVRMVGEEPLKSNIPGDDGDPQRQWEVEVSEVFKGEDAAGSGLAPGERVVVNVDGGIDPETGRHIVIASAGDTPHAVDVPVEEGASYVFFVRVNERKDWFEVSAQPYGKVLVQTREDYEEERAEVVAAMEEQVNPLEGQVVSD